MAYDALDRLVATGVGVEVGYDSLDRIVVRRDGLGERRFGYAGVATDPTFDGHTVTGTGEVVPLGSRYGHSPAGRLVSLHKPPPTVALDLALSDPIAELVQELIGGVDDLLDGGRGGDRGRPVGGSAVADVVQPAWRPRRLAHR